MNMSTNRRIAVHNSLSELLNDLKAAVHHSLAHDQVLAGMAALDKVGQVVNVAVDFTVISEGSEEHANVGRTFDSTPELNIEFSRSDAFFWCKLRSTGGSVGLRPAE
jgi:hypothetical protein